MHVSIVKESGLKVEVVSYKKKRVYIREGGLSLPSDLDHLNIFCSPGSHRQNALLC